MQIDRAKARLLATSLAPATQRVGMTTLRLGLGLVFAWFGALKLVGQSPAEDLVLQTLWFLPGTVSMPLLGVWETLIGVCLLLGRTRLALPLLLCHLPGTFLPFVIVPEICFDGGLLGLSLEGQYIVKNLVLVGAALVLVGSPAPGEPRAD